MSALKPSLRSVSSIKKLDQQISRVVFAFVVSCKTTELLNHCPSRELYDSLEGQLHYVLEFLPSHISSELDCVLSEDK